MKNFKKLIKEAHLGNPLNEDRFKKNKDSYIRISEPSFRKDKNNPNFLSAYINYDTGPGVGMALGKETMAGQIRRLSSAEALRQMEIIAGKLEDSYDLEDIDVTDLENGVVELFAVSDDFIDMDPRSELSMAMLGENQKYDDEDIVIYDGEEHIIMSRDGNMIYIRPLEDSAILGKKDVIKVPARALAYKSDLDKMYDEYKPKDEINEENEKLDHIARAEYGKSFAMLDDDERKAMLKAMSMNRETEKEFETDFERRRKGDYSDDMEDGMTDYQRGRMDEGFKKGDKVTYLGNPAEITFVGKDQMDRTYYSVSYDKGKGKTKASNLYNKDGEIKAVKEDMNDPVLMKARAAKIADEKEKAKQAALNKKYGSSFMDKLDAELDLKAELEDLNHEREMIMIDMEEEAEPEGGPIADRYGERLNQIDMRIADIQEELDDLRMYESLNEAEIPLWLTDNREFEKAVIVSTSYNDFEKRAYGILGPKYFKLLLSQSPGVLKDYYDSIRVTRPSMEEGNGGAKQDFTLNINNPGAESPALDVEVNKMGYSESLQETLRRNLANRLK